MKKMMDWISNTWSNRGCLGKVIVLTLALLLLACPCGLLSSLLPSTPTPTPTPRTVTKPTPVATLTSTPLPVTSELSLENVCSAFEQRGLALLFIGEAFDDDGNRPASLQSSERDVSVNLVEHVDRGVIYGEVFVSREVGDDALVGTHMAALLDLLLPDWRERGAFLTQGIPLAIEGESSSYKEENTRVELWYSEPTGELCLRIDLWPPPRP